MKTLMLSEIAKGIQGSANAEARISGVSIDSRTIRPGDLYIAIVGERFDGHDFIDAAAAAGAAAVMSHKDVDCACPVLRVEDTEQAFLRLASWYRNLLGTFVVALTGSVGKTTTKEMVAAVLASERTTCKTEGNLNNQIGVPRTLMRLDESTQAAVIEMGMSGFGQISELSSCVCPDAAIITNIGVSHMEHLGSREGILAAKLEILDGLKAGGTLFLNADDPYLMSAQAGEHPIKYYGVNNTVCDYKAENIEAKEYSTVFDIVWDGGSQRIVLPTIGIHNVYNAVAAFAVGVENGIAPASAAKGLAGYTPSGMRQRLCKKGGITFVEDCYNASPDSVRAALGTLADLKAERKIAVLGDMLELGSISEEAHRTSGSIAAKKGVNALFTLGERSRLTAQKAQELGVAQVESFDTNEALAERLTQVLAPGDAVLFKASRAMQLETAMHAVYAALEEADAQ